MMQKALFPGQYLQGAGAFKELPALVKKYGSKAMLLALTSVINRILPAHSVGFAPDQFMIEQFGGKLTIGIYLDEILYAVFLVYTV